MSILLEATDLKKSHGSATVLKGVGLSLSAGQLTAIIGPSGSGKTTLLKCLSGITEPDEGRVLVLGQLLSEESGRKSKRSLFPDLTYVFQGVHLWPHLTVLQNIAVPAELRFGSDSWVQPMRELTEELEVSHVLDRYPREVSGGEAQRVGIVRALVLQPKILLMDEVTSALGVDHVSKVLKIALRYRENGGAAAFVTHHIGFAMAMADNVLFMKNGQVQDAGSPKEVAANPSSHLAAFLDENKLLQGA